MKIIVFCSLTPLSVVDVERRFGGKHYLSLQDRKVNLAFKEVIWRQEE
jgi:hypothetical protein